MRDLWASGSYEPQLLSLPFALAPAAMLIVIAFAVVMRGAPRLRGWLLVHCLALLPYAVAMTLSPSIVDGEVAFTLFQIAVACIPLAAAAGTAFQLTLIRRYREYRVWIWIGVISAAAWLVITPATRWAIDDIRHLDTELWFPTPGPGAPIALLHTIVVSVPGFLGLGYVALTSRPSDERRQLRLALLANLVTYAGLVDVGLAYGIGVFPLGWLLSGIGSLLVVRALIVEDLLRVRAVDTTAPMLVLHVAAAILLGWIVLELLGPRAPWWVAGIALVMSFAGVRSSIATITLVNRGGRAGEGPLERLLAQLVVRARDLTEAARIAQLAIDIVELGIGVRPQVLLASAEDWGWTTATGARLADEVAPDPLLTGWLAEQHGEAGEMRAVFADDLDRVPADLRELVVALFEHHDARVLVPVGAADDLIGLVLLGGRARALRGRPLAFVERAADRLAEALLHARMARRAAERANLAREVELAATVQAELLPGKGPHVHGDVTVVGSWLPATRCAGDFWGVYPLPDQRLLVAIGDVTGHGVASAMVTAAAVGAIDVCVRRGGKDVDLRELMSILDTTVRHVGGGHLAMTAFVAMLDPAARELRFVSCGHTAPYLCRPTEHKVELHALVGRGNLLGAGVPGHPKLLQRSFEPGDLLVWYTDGVIDAQDPGGKPFGDRRLQQLLRRLDRARLSPAAVRDHVNAAVAAHRAGHPLADDETIVVAQLAFPTPASLEPARTSGTEVAT